MGQVPPKYFAPPTPYGSSQAVNTLQPVQNAAINPQVPLLPPNFTDPGAQIASQVTRGRSPISPQHPFPTRPGGGRFNDFG